METLRRILFKVVNGDFREHRSPRKRKPLHYVHEDRWFFQCLMLHINKGFNYIDL